MTHALTLRLDDATYQKLRRQSYEQIRPISDLIREALMRPTDAEIRRDQAEKDRDSLAELLEPFSGIGLANGATRSEVAAWIRVHFATPSPEEPTDA